MNKIIGPFFRLLLIGLILLAHTNIWAQKPQREMEDEFAELEGELTLNIFNALDGKPIAGGVVWIEKVGEFVTDEEGKARFPIPPEDGFYNVIFKKEGFIETHFNIEITAGTMFFDRISISPALTAGAVRVVLDWSAEPRDLDAHLVKIGNYHISYRDKRVSDDKTVQLDRDDTDGYGPETITINKIDSKGEYVFFVHDFTNQNKANSTALSKSKACIRVYYAGQLLYNWRVPLKTKGFCWEVFRIQQGNIVPVNQIRATLP